MDSQPEADAHALNYTNAPHMTDGYAAPQDLAAHGSFSSAGYSQMGYDVIAAPAGDASDNPYGGGDDTYSYGGQPMNAMYPMMYSAQAGASENMFFAPQMGGTAPPGMGGGNMFDASMMGMGMGGPMGMGMGMGYQQMGAEVTLTDQFGGMALGARAGGKGGGRGRSGGRGLGGGFDSGMGKGKGKGKGFVHSGGLGMDGRGRGKGMHPAALDDRSKRDDERDRERARNGVRGLRSGGFGGMSPMGPPMHTPEVVRLMETINPEDFDVHPKYARFFVIKSYSEDDVHKSIKYGVWASTDTGNRRLDSAYRETGKKGPIYLFFSVNASGQFSGMAQMESALDYTQKFGVWAQDKWSGTFLLKWTFIKDIPNSQFRHILLANNEHKPVTNSRDTQEIMLEQGREMLRIFHQYKSKTSILDDFGFYDKRQELMEQRTVMLPAASVPPHGMGVPQCLGIPPQAMQPGVGMPHIPSLGFDPMGMPGVPLGVPLGGPPGVMGEYRSQ